jgi:hypothetical protein
MRSLREPVSAKQSAMILMAVVGIWAVQGWSGGSLSVGQWLVLVLALEFVVQPLSTLLHELGHAAAVMCLAKRSARVVVGREPWVELIVGGLHLRFSLVPARGVSFRGVCVYDSIGVPWRTLGLIALAGPLATLAELGVLAAATPVLWHTGAVARGLVVLTLGGLVASLLTNLSGAPLEASRRRAVVAQRDGWNARRAFALHRQGAPPTAPANSPAQTS